MFIIVDSLVNVEIKFNSVLKKLSTDLYKENCDEVENNFENLNNLKIIFAENSLVWNKENTDS